MCEQYFSLVAKVKEPGSVPSRGTEVSRSTSRELYKLVSRRAPGGQEVSQPEAARDWNRFIGQFRICRQTEVGGLAIGHRRGVSPAWSLDKCSCWLRAAGARSWLLQGHSQE